MGRGAGDELYWEELPVRDCSVLVCVRLCNSVKKTGISLAYWVFETVSEKTFKTWDEMKIKWNEKGNVCVCAGDAGKL